MKKLKEALSDKRVVTAALVFGIGLLLLMLSLIGGKKEKDEDLSEEKMLCNTISSISGCGEAEVSIRYKEERGGYLSSDKKEIAGIAILCEGAESMRVKSEIYALCRKVYGVGENHVFIYKKDFSGGN